MDGSRCPGLPGEQGAVDDDVRAVVDPMGNAGDLNLGVKILREFVMVVDFGRHSIWLAPAKSNVLTPSMEN